MSENKIVGPKKLSRREFLRDAGIVVGGTAISSAFFLTACGEEKEITKTVTTTAPGTTSTVTATAPGTTSTQTQTQTQTAVSSRYVCPICTGEFETIALLKSHFEAVHPGAGQILIKSAYISWNPDECAACSRCVMACAAVHSGSVALQLSGIKWVDKQEFYGFDPRMPVFCQQCTQPECYFACPLKDIAMCIDEETGSRYVNQEKCNGCGLCMQACPFEIPRVTVDITAPIAQRKAFKCDLCKDRENGPVCIEVCNRDALTLAPAEGRL